MTREEAITQLDLLLEYCESMMTSEYPVWRRDCEALQMLIAALRPVRREQVEKVWKGEWEMSKAELYRLALSTYGAQAQTMMVMEEMAELQKELCKHARGKENRAQIAEEIADVQIMLEQMELLHDCEGLVAGFKAQKLDRLEKRLREG